MLRVVLDVNVLVSATIAREGPPARAVRAWMEGAFELVVSPQLVAELSDVLARPRVASTADRSDVSDLHDALLRAAVSFDDPPPRRYVRADRSDDYLVDLAIAANAHMIVTGDRHLIEGAVDAPVRVMKPAEFVALLERLPA